MWIATKFRIKPVYIKLTKHRSIERYVGTDVHAVGRPTSGLIAVALARSMCAEVHVYGFGLSKTQLCAKYYGRHCEPPAQYQKTEWHDLALEKDYLDRESVPVLSGFGNRPSRSLRAQQKRQAPRS